MANLPVDTAKRRRQRGHGFSLIETMVALMVLAFGLLTVASAQIHAMRAGQTGRHKTRAMAIAQSQMEQLQGLTWSNIAATGWTAGQAVTTDIDAPNNMVEQSYLVQWRISDAIPNSMREIDVRVSWAEISGRTDAFTVTSNRFNYEGL